MFSARQLVCLSAGSAVCFTCLLAGCAGSQPYAGNCTAQTTVTTGQTRGYGNFTLSLASGSDFTIFPGQTAGVPVTVNPVDGATGNVLLTAEGLPSGVTMDSVSAQIGSTVTLQFNSTPALGAECFRGVSQVFTAYSTLNLHGSGSSGDQMVGVDMDMTLENPAFRPTTTTLPTLTINTTDAAPVDSEDTYVTASMQISGGGSGNNYSGTLQIKGHGNTTWLMPKKPYRLKLDSKSKLLGMPSEKNWVLLANYDDKTMLRDALASQISNITGLPWAPRSQFVEVMLNGEYEGTYQLIENVDINSSRVNIADSDTDPTDPTANGYLMEIDQRESDTFHWITPHGIDLGSDDPDPPTAAEEPYIQNLVNEAEASFYAADAASPTTGWRSYWNESSVVDWFIVNELMGNEDGDAFSSDYFYKDAGNSPFVMGPIWDFDVSSGNDNYGAIQDPTVPWIRTRHPWYAQLFTDATFQADVQTRWSAIRSQVGTLPAFLDTNAAALTQAAANNYSRWPNLYQEVWPNPEAAGSYTGEVSYLKFWLNKRIAYMDSQYLK